jgi:hypothetical protein
MRAEGVTKAVTRVTRHVTTSIPDLAFRTEWPWRGRSNNEIPAHLWSFFPSHFPTIFLLTILMFWVAVALAQAPRPAQVSVEDSPRDVASWSFEQAKQAGKPLLATKENPRLIFSLSAGKTESDRGLLRRSSDQFLLSSKGPVLELAKKRNYLMDTAPKPWLADVTAHEDNEASSSRDLKYYAGRTPLIGPAILRIAQQADAHPRVTRLLLTLDPQF